MNAAYRRSASRWGRDRGNVGIELLAGLVAALICATLWAVLAHNQGAELIYVVPGIGIIVGLVVSVSTRKRSADSGVTAAGLTAIAVLLGKLIIVQWSISTGLTSNTVATPAPTAEKAQQVEAPPPDQAQADGVDTILAGEQLASQTGKMPHINKIKNALSAIDLLWIGSAMLLAFVIGMAPVNRAKPAPNQAEEAGPSEES